MAFSSTLLLAATLQVGGLSGGTEVNAEAGVPGESPRVTAHTHDGSANELNVANPWIEAADIRVDGRLDEAAWAEAPILHGFTQFEPREGVPATQRTEVRVLVTDEAVLFGIEAFDDVEGGIRGTLAQRDSYGRSDDYVRVVLDTFNDQRRAFVFQVNPLGVQGDGLWIEGRGGRGGPVDWSPDFVWESSGQMLADRYVVEFKVPFKSLRFPDTDLQDWGLQVTRRIQRNGYEASWAPMSGDQANQLAQAGTLSGLEGLDPGLFMEINPVTTASRSGSWDANAGAFSQGPTVGDFGMNLTYGLTSNLTLDGTFNPDFSQVEADAGQIAVNERFALFLSEQRPFFLEGTDVFSMPMRLVHTRTITKPVGAAKLSGKVGNFSVAYIGAVDQASSSGDNPVVNLVRVRKDVGASSTLGLVYTDRTTPGVSFNRVVGADARMVLGGRYTVEFMAAGSADGAEASATDYGSLVTARFQRSGRNFSMSGGFQDIDSSFRAGSGFIRRVDNTQARFETGYTWRGARGAWVESFGPSIEVEGNWDRDAFWAGNAPEEREVQLRLFTSFRNNIGGFLSYSRSGFSLGAGEYDGLFLTDEGGSTTSAFAPAQSLFQGLDGISLRSWISSWERVRFSLGGSIRETPVFDRSKGLPADVANSFSGDFNVSLYPTGSLVLEVGARHVTLKRQLDGSTYSSATIPRLQARYQFSRALFTRVIGEYASQERGEVHDPITGRPLSFCGDETCSLQSGSDRYDFSIQALLGYEPTPGTVFFAGYTRQMRDSVGFRFRDVQTQADGVFIKLSYRFRM